MRLGCRILVGVLFWVVSFVTTSVSQDFPIVVYGDPFQPCLSGPTGPDSQFTLLKNLGVTHVIGAGVDTVVSLAANKSIKFIAATGVFGQPVTNNCFPSCILDPQPYLVPISSACPKFIERFTEWGYKVDFEVEEDDINHNKGYAFRLAKPRFGLDSSSVRIDNQGYLSQVSNPNLVPGYMFKGPVDSSSRHFSSKSKDTLWSRADFVMQVGDISGNPNTVVAKVVVATGEYCRWCAVKNLQCDPNSLCPIGKCYNTSTQTCVPDPCFHGCPPCNTDPYWACIYQYGALPPPDSIRKDTTLFGIPIKVDTIVYGPDTVCGVIQTVPQFQYTYAWIREVKVSDFPAANVSTTISLPYLHIKDIPFSFQVYWTKQKDLFVDKVAVSNFEGRRLDSLETQASHGEYNSARQFIKDFYDSLAAPLERWYFLDEAYGGSVHSADNADDLVRSRQKTGSTVETRFFNVWNASWTTTRAYEDFLATVDPPELHHDNFTNLCNVDSTSFSPCLNCDAECKNCYPESRQRNYNLYISGLRHIGSAARSFQKQFWVNVQIEKFIGYDESANRFKEALREPLESEINAAVFLAVAYGAKGISYYLYPSTYYGNVVCSQSSSTDPSTGPEFERLAADTMHGIMSPAIVRQAPSGASCQDYGTSYSGVKFRGLVDWSVGANTWVPNEKWFWVKKVNDKLKKIGPTLLGLNWLSADSLQNAAGLTGSFITSASSAQFPLDQAFVEVAFFSGDHFMLVNRRVKGAEAQDVTVNISRNGLYTITNLVDDSALIVGNTCGTGFLFKTRLNPGEGKLFKLTPYTGNLHGLAAIDSVCTELTADGDVTVPFGGNMNFKAGGKLRFVANTDVLASGRSTTKGEFVIKGAVVATGSSSNPVVFNSAAASPGTQDWHSVRVEPGGSFKPTYAHFKHAYCGIDYRNSAADVVQNCLFQDDYMYGIRDSLNSNLTINNSRFDNLYNYGLYLDLANAAVTADTFYNVSMAINAYKSYGQIRNNVITTTTSGFFNAIFGFRAEGQVPPPGTQKATFALDSISGVFDEAAIVANGGVAIESCRIWTKLPAILPDPVPLSIGIQGLGTAAATVRNTTVKMFSSSTTTVPAVQVTGTTPVLDLDAYCNYPCPDPPPNRHNRIYRAGTSAKAVQNLTTSTVLARSNWWGTSSPTSSYFSNYVTWQPYLTSDPGPLGKPAAPSDDKTGVPLAFSLGQNYPNPFNPTTTISFSLPNAEKVQLKVYNILGQEVRTLFDEEKAAGIHQIVWNGMDQNGLMVSSGLYFYKFQTPSYKEVKRMMFIK